MNLRSHLTFPNPNLLSLALQASTQCSTYFSCPISIIWHLLHCLSKSSLMILEHNPHTAVSGPLLLLLPLLGVPSSPSLYTQILPTSKTQPLLQEGLHDALAVSPTSHPRTFSVFPKSPHHAVS